MTVKNLLFLLTILSLFNASCSKQTPISGDVFIVSGRDNIKLGLVEVSAYKAEKILPVLNAKDSERGSRYEDFETYRSTCSSIDSSRYSECVQKADDKLYEVLDVYKKELPSADVVANTDADGKFSMTLPKAGRYVLVATTSPKDEATGWYKKYFWFVPVTSDGKVKTLSLSNNNLASPNISPAIGISPKQ